MDDIDIGVDTYEQARRVVRDVDIVLHTRQVRLNSGKTLILTAEQAERHFRIRDNRFLDLVTRRIRTKEKAGASINRERRHLLAGLRKYYFAGRFDGGNGEKILKRVLTLARRTHAEVPTRLLKDILQHRPACRSGTLLYIGSKGLAPERFRLLAEFLTSGHLVDDVSIAETVETLVESDCSPRANATHYSKEIVEQLRRRVPFGVHASIWLSSKYYPINDLFNLLRGLFDIWRGDALLGRLVGGMFPLFKGTPREADYIKLVGNARNVSADETLDFHRQLSDGSKFVAAVGKFIRAANSSRPLGITHSKFLMLLSVLQNPAVSDAEKKKYLAAHSRAWADPYYRATARRMVPSHFRPLVRAT
jgi:hypothetical protein